MDGITSEIAQRLNERVGELAQHLMGEPNRSLSTSRQLRFGSKGSVAVEIAGPKQGRWYDHEAEVGGDGLELVRHHFGYANGKALDWARDWLGASGRLGERAARGPGLSNRGRAVSAKLVDNVAKVATIVSKCIDPVGTCAESYLRQRDITVSNLPGSLRFRRNAFGRYHALVALATDATGEVHAVHQVYLTDDGRKAPIPIQKRTNKAHDGWSEVAAVRLPGNTPLVLCEGVETALSVWQATGQETWACLGIANIARAPVPEGATLVVARDGDAPDSKAEHQLRKAVAVLRQRGHKVLVAEPPPGQDFNDLLVAEAEQAVRDAVAAATEMFEGSIDWRGGLLRNKEGWPRAVLANAIHALREAPEWQDVLWHDEFATKTVARRPPPWISSAERWVDTSWSDREDMLTAEWLQRQGILVAANVAGQAVEVVARDRCFHPVRSYLAGLHWDGVPRVETWLSTYLGAADDAYARAVGPRWLIAAVARIQDPGCKADCALVLEGPQGIRKSSALRALGQPWFSDRLSELGSKDAALELSGVWIVEIAELDSMSRAEAGTIKAFMSRSHDRFRPPYGKRVIDLPRQCVFAGSVNPEGGYLKDATGGRRFWPVACGTIDIAAIERDRDQLLAEALQRYRNGDPWWLESRELEALASEEQADRYQDDAWAEPIQKYLEHTVDWTGGLDGRRPHYHPPAEPLDDISVAEVLEHALGIEKGRWTQTDQNRVVRCLVSMGFRRYRRRRGDDRERRYRRDPLAGEGR